MDSYDYITQPQRDPYRLVWLTRANPPPPRKHRWRERDTLCAQYRRVCPEHWLYWSCPNCSVVEAD